MKLKKTRKAKASVFFIGTAKEEKSGERKTGSDP
jgi:hypothetical protein